MRVVERFLPLYLSFHAGLMFHLIVFDTFQYNFNAFYKKTEYTLSALGGKQSSIVLWAPMFGCFSVRAEFFLSK